MGESEASLFGGREPDGIGKLNEQQPIDETFNGSTGADREIQGERNAKNDGNLGNNRRFEKRKSNGMGRTFNNLRSSMREIIQKQFVEV